MGRRWKQTRTALGELLVTAGAVSTIFFLYRVFVTFFPVIAAQEQEA